MRHSLKNMIFIAMFAAVPAVFYTAAPAWSGVPVLLSPQEEEKEPGNLAVLGIEELMNIKITSTARKPIKLSDATSAVFVITAEDIRHSGALTIPDVLRMVPGLEVARISANQWAVSSRGFNGRFANKLLVLIDGRSIYAPSFSGVYWEVQDLLLEDIQRIEVIRGPGATLWGANAVNGVINIITKPASDTLGSLVVAGAGTEERGFTGIRYGGFAGADVAYRVYAKHAERNGSVSSSGVSYNDDGSMDRGGFRFDVAASGKDSITFQGDAYSGLAGQLLSLPSLAPPYAEIVEDQPRVDGGNILGRWQRKISPTSDLNVQVYYDRTERREATYHEEQNTVDIEFDHRFRLGARQEIIWGAGYRLLSDDIRGTYFTEVDPTSRRNDLLCAFVQDEITAIADRLVFMAGTKIERNDYTNYEFQPNVRMLWTPDERHTVWTAVSRAVRTPSRIESDVQANIAVVPPDLSNPLPTLIRVQAGDHFLSEVLIAYEAGYRIKPADTVFIDIALFYNIYNNLRSGEPASLDYTNLPSYVVQPIVFDNKLEGRVHGMEVSADWRPCNWWSLNIAYTFLEMNLHKDSDSLDTLLVKAGGENPRHQVSFRSSMNLSRNVELDAWLRSVDDLPSLGVDQYMTLDLRLGWRPRKNLELVLTGQSLLDDRHPEFVRENFSVPVELQRSVYVKAAWSF